MVETAGLENLYAARHRGFESLPLRIFNRKNMKKIIFAVLGLSLILAGLYVYVQKKSADKNGQENTEVLVEDYPRYLDWKSCYDLPRKIITCEYLVCESPITPRIPVSSYYFGLNPSRIITGGLTQDSKCNFTLYSSGGDIKCSLDEAQAEKISKYYKKLIDAPGWAKMTRKKVENIIPREYDPFEKLIADGSCIYHSPRPH